MMFKSHVVRISCIFLLILASGFMHAQDEETGLFESPPAKTKAQSLQEATQDFIVGNNLLGFELYANLKKQSGNLFFSPFSIFSALAMPYFGSAATTRTQMQIALHFPAQDEFLDEAISKLISRLSTSWYLGPNENRLFIANSLWFQYGQMIKPSFRDELSKYFKAPIQGVDFRRNPDSARLNINNWVRQSTQGRMENLLQKSDISPSTKLMLISAIFMKSVWLNPFDAGVTVHSSFFTESGSTISVPMMTRGDTYRYFQHSMFALLDIPYRNNPIGGPELSLLVFLPRSNSSIDALESLLTPENLNKWVDQLQFKPVILSLPRFKLIQQFDLTSLLQTMGLNLAFTDSADFSGISDSKDLFINKMIHKAYLSVDEKGTEAIAASAISLKNKINGRDSQSIIFRADHPFMFILIEKSSGLILFMGRLSFPPEGGL